MSSTVLRGFALNRPAEGQIKHLKKAKIAVFSGRVDTAQTETKGTVLIKTAAELVNYSAGEERKMEEIIKQIADTGVNCVVSGSGFGEMALHFLEKYGIMAFKCLSKFDLRRLCRAVGATALVRLGAPTAEEIGFADTVDTQEIGSERVTVFINESEESKISTILVRSSTLNLLDNIEHTIDDGVNVFKAMTKSNAWVAGAAATEIEISRQLEKFASSLPGLDQYSVRSFAQAFSVVARTLAENSGQDAAVVIANLLAAHEAGDVHQGINIEEGGGILNAKEAGIFDLLVTKTNAIRLAAEAATTVLKVDQIIMSKPAGGPKPKNPAGQDEDD
jgi:T-complex protein 1 subunit theta